MDYFMTDSRMQGAETALHVDKRTKEKCHRTQCLLDCRPFDPVFTPFCGFRCEAIKIAFDTPLPSRRGSETDT